MEIAVPDIPLYLDPELRVVATEDPTGPPFIAQTSWGIVEAHVQPRALEALLRAFEVTSARDEVVEAFCAEHEHDLERASAIVDHLIHRGILVAGGAAGPSPIWLEASSGPALAPYVSAARYRRILVVGSGPLAEQIAQFLEGKNLEVSRLAVRPGPGPAVAPHPRFAASTSRGAPDENRLDLGALESAVSTVDLAVFAMEGVTFASLLAGQSAAERAGCRSIAALVCGFGVELGPLLIPGGPWGAQHGAPFAFVDGSQLDLCAAFVSQPTNRVDPAVLIACADYVYRSVCDPAHSLATRVLYIGPDAVLERPLPRPPTDQMFLAGGAAPEFDLSTHLDARLDADLCSKIQGRLSAGEMVVIRDAFRADFAEAVHRALDATGVDPKSKRRWRLYEHMRPYFHFHHHNIYDPEEYFAEARFMELIVGSRSTVEFIESLSQERCRTPPEVSPSWYMAGDHSTPHSDIEPRGRKVAFIWHLSKDWQPDWGGELYWCATGTAIPPSFNSLILFKVSPSTKHFVVHVAAHAAGKRLAMNGWWKGDCDEQLPPATAESLDEDGRVLTLPSRRAIALPEPASTGAKYWGRPESDEGVV